MARKSPEEVQKLAPYLVGPEGKMCQEMVDALTLTQFMECIRINFYDIIDILKDTKFYRNNLKHACRQFEDLLNGMLQKAYIYYKYLDNHSLFAELAVEFNNAFDISPNDIYTKYVLIDVLIEQINKDFSHATGIQTWDVVKFIPQIKSMYSKVKSHLDKVLTDLPSYDEVYKIFDEGTNNLHKNEEWLYAYFEVDDDSNAELLTD